MDREEVNPYVNRYCVTRDIQFAAYELYARRFGLTAKELFVLDIVWFSPDGCSQTDICERMSATKQTISAIVRKFSRMGYLTLTESDTDHRNKIIRMTPAGEEYIRRVIQPAADAENLAMMDLDDDEIRELVRITEKFSQRMVERFEETRTE